MTCGLTLAGRLAYAETLARRNTILFLLRAAQLDHFATPAPYFERLAELDPDSAALWLDAALQANPRSTSARISKAFAAEHAGHFDAAERDLLQAATHDRQYLPAWTLANFYFRRDNSIGFWLWAHRAASLTYDDFRPLLALAHSLELDPREVISRLGGGTPLLHADLDYLTQQGRLDQAQQIARLLLERKSPGDASRLLALADRQIRAGHARDALELWNDVLPPALFPPLDPDRNAVANGNLATAPSGIAFDWHLPSAEGLTSMWRPSQLAFSLSGAQPETCALLEQIVPLSPAKRYRLHFEYLTRGLSSPTGLAWDLDGDSGAPIGLAASWQPAETLLLAKRQGTEPFRLSKLRLLYRRNPGTVRAQGQIQLRNLHMESL